MRLSSALLAIAAIVSAPAAHGQSDAERAYLDVLEGAAPGDAAVQQTLPLLPDSVAAHVRLGSPGAGAEVARWWRTQDPLPSTLANERLGEHVERVTVALGRFAARTPVGYDARGDTFVRFGAPRTVRVVDPEADLFIARMIREEPAVRRSDFPRNEAWHYPNLGAYYVFVETPDGYVEGTLVDLIPRALRGGGYNVNTEQRSRLLGKVIRWIHKDLFAFDTNIQRRLSDIDASIGGDGAVLYDSNTRRQTGLILSNIVQRSQMEDERVRRDRDERLPAASSLTAPQGRVAARPARFLDGPIDAESGSIWVGWSQPILSVTQAADSLGVGGGASPFRIDVTGTRLSGDYDRLSNATDTYLVLPGGEASEPQWAVLGRVGRSERAAFQWDVTPADRDGSPTTGAPLSQSVVRVDPIGDLVPVAATVALSDLVVLDGRALEAALDADRLDGLPAPLPYEAVPADLPTVLYYEAYGPGVDRAPAGVTVRLDVDVTRSRDGRLLRARVSDRTTSGSELTLVGGREPQIVVLDPETLVDADEVTVEVTVTRSDTGERAARRLRLRIARPL